jgi:hypothetical protein
VQPEVFQRFQALRHLYLQNNQITNIHPSTFQSNIHLITLDLSGNKLTELRPYTFQNNRYLLWVNITGNPVKVLDVQPTIFTLSLNTVDIDTCNKAEYSINYFQEIPYLREVNLKENTVFTVKNLKSYQNIKPEEMSLENAVFSKLINFNYNDSTELSFDPIRKVILSPSNTSLMCFCSRLSAWFWCSEWPISCAGHTAAVYSLLNCSVTPTPELLNTSSSLSADALSRVMSTTAATTENQTNFTTNTSTYNTYPAPGTVDTNWILYGGIGATIIIIIIVVVVVVVVVARLRRNNRVPGGIAEYRSVSQNTYDATSASPYCRPQGSQRSPTYSQPYDFKQFTSFQPPTPSSARTAANIRHNHAEND